MSALVENLRRCATEGGCAGCDYNEACDYGVTLLIDAADEIERLLVSEQALRNAANGFKERAEKAERDLSKAIASIPNTCEYCRHSFENGGHEHEACDDCYMGHSKFECYDL